MLTVVLSPRGVDIPSFQGEIGDRHVGEGDEFIDFLFENEERVVYLDIMVTSEFTKEKSAAATSVYTFDVYDGTPPAVGCCLVVELRVDPGTDFFLGEWHNGKVNVRGHFSVMGNAGLGTGLSVTTLRALSANEATVLSRMKRRWTA